MRRSICFTMIGIIATMTGMSAFGLSNASLIRKLTNEKKQKMQILEKCTKKVKGFQAAGISTLGLTAAGAFGDVALIKKNKSLDSQISKVNSDIETKKSELTKKQQEIEKAEKTLEERKAKCNAPNSYAKWNEETNRCVCDDRAKTWVNDQCVELPDRVIGHSCLGPDLEILNATKGTYVINKKSNDDCLTGTGSTEMVKCSCQPSACATTGAYGKTYMLTDFNKCVENPYVKSIPYSASANITGEATYVSYFLNNGKERYTTNLGNGSGSYNPPSNEVSKPGDWYVRFGDQYIKGMSVCAGYVGEYYGVVPESNQRNIQKEYEDQRSIDAQYCYCKTTNSSGNGKWVYMANDKTYDKCINECAWDCAHNVADFPTMRNFLLDPDY